MGIAGLLPASVVATEAFCDLPEPLFPQEEAAIARAVPGRRAEFRSVRGCARVALDRLGMDRPPLVPGPRGAPTWPTGVVGTMTHCTGYRAAAVARIDDVAGLGIDAEPHAPLPPEVLDLVCLPEERLELERLGLRRTGVCWDRILFSVKESVYKTWFPLTGAWLGFEHARVRFEPDSRAVHTELLVDGLTCGGRPVTQLRGRWLVRHGLVLTAVVLPSSFPRPPSSGPALPPHDT